MAAARGSGATIPRLGRQPERTEASRRALIEATIAVLATEGYRAATVARIQETSGLSRGLVGYHFGSKAKLMEAVVEHIRSDYQAQTSATGEREHVAGRDQVLEMFDSYLSRLARRPNPAKAMLVLAIESGTESTAVRRAVQDAYARVREIYVRMLRKGIEDGTVRGTVDPEAHAGVLQGMLRGIVLQYSLDPEGFDLESMKKAALASLEHDLSPG
ncbi:TetR/AcrR family transcriptional regulator [Nonomuraea lactucae]|uniref:TetR/AcrR family transcriptional regulator n=1 Tax=Nonomuraea lactucae TaxID=2249762 RepID=UPI0013B3E108|nr:TetR/AcrR family transcriptional regulator [Nonomuraea lactucae]